MLRLFAALPIPDQIAERIIRLQSGLEGAKWSPRENLHVTLRFCGEMNERQAEELDATLGDIRAVPFELGLQNVGFFGGETPHAVWLGIKTNPALLALQKQCERACRRAGLLAEARQYTPHVTICYLPNHYPLRDVASFQQNNNLFQAPDFVADRFYLYASRTTGRGPSRYNIEAEYPLIS